MQIGSKRGKLREAIKSLIIVDEEVKIAFI